MNDKIIEQLLKYMDETKDFVLQGCPEIITEILTYEKYLCIFCLCIFVPVSLICATTFLYNAFYPEYETYGSMKFKNACPLIVSGFFFLVSFGVLCDATTSLIKISTAPKYFIIQKIMKIGK